MNDIYCFSITFECNWNCEYCIVDTHNKNKPIIDYDYINNIINKIPQGSNCSFGGGEPGMANSELIEYLFNKLEKKNCKISITTNGLFMKLYPEYYNRIVSYFYHCSENIVIDDINFYKDIDNKIEYMIVVSDNNIKRLESFLEFYKDINITLYSARRSPIKKEGNTLSIRNDYKLQLLYKSKKYNITNGHTFLNNQKDNIIIV